MRVREEKVYVSGPSVREEIYFVHCARVNGDVWNIIDFVLTILIFFCALADPHEFFCHQKLCVNSDKKIQFYEINI